jgi:hypothetical protein
MVAKNLEQAVSRFKSATSRIREGLTIQRQRIQDAYDAAPRIFEGEPFEWVEVSGISVNDVDYYAYELVRLWKTAEAMQRPLGFPQELTDAIEEFAKAFPRLLTYRNATTHFANTPDLDNVVVLSSALEPDDDGMSLRAMVSPLSEQDHGVAMALLRVMEKLLTRKLQESMAADPPQPLNEKIRIRNEKHGARGD